MRKAIIIGSGGHCRVVLSILNSLNTSRAIKIIDLGSPEQGETIMGIDVVAFYDALIDEYIGVEYLDFFLAIGDSHSRKFWWKKLHSYGLQMPTLISPYALVDSTAILEGGNVICPNAFIGPFVRLELII